MYMCLVCFGRQIDRLMLRGPRTAFKSWFSHFPMLVPRTQFRLSYLAASSRTSWAIFVAQKKIFHCRQISKSIIQFLNLCMGLIFWEFDKCLPLENELESNSLRAWVIDKLYPANLHRPLFILSGALYWMPSI